MGWLGVSLGGSDDPNSFKTACRQNGPGRKGKGREIFIMAELRQAQRVMHSSTSPLTIYIVIISTSRNRL